MVNSQANRVRDVISRQRVGASATDCLATLHTTLHRVGNVVCASTTRGVVTVSDDVLRLCGSKQVSGRATVSRTIGPRVVSGHLGLLWYFASPRGLIVLNDTLSSTQDTYLSPTNVCYRHRVYGGEVFHFSEAV